MGTEYVLRKDSRAEVSIGEISNELSIISFDESAGRLVATEEMEPEQMLHLLLKGIVATSYWMEEEKFNEIFNSYEFYSFYNNNPSNERRS